MRNKGLRIVGGGHRLELPGPSWPSFPPLRPGAHRASTSTRCSPGTPRRPAPGCRRAPGHRPGARRAHRPGRRRHARAVDERGRKAGDELTYRAPVVVAADGVSARIAIALGLSSREDRPMGVAVRAYYETPRHDDDYLESWLELWDGTPGRSNLLPGYGWIFGMGDGTANVGLGMLNTSRPSSKADYQDVLKRWLDHTPEEWGFRDENRVGPIRGAALPMGFNRKPHYTRGPAAGRRLRRHGQPVQRRGHRLRDGVRPTWPPTPSSRRSPGPTGPARERGRSRATRGARADVRRLLHARPRLRQADRQPDGHDASQPSTACRVRR